MARHGGARAFFRGAPATCVRDAVFGGVFSGARSLAHGGGEATRLHADTAAAAAATIASSPFNFVRNIQFNANQKEPAPSAAAVLRRLLVEAAAKEGVAGKLGHVQERLRVGWGTLRVAAGMAASPLVIIDPGSVSRV
jgi:hypothetical protein